METTVLMNVVTHPVNIAIAAVVVALVIGGIAVACKRRRNKRAWFNDKYKRPAHLYGYNRYTA